MTLEHLIKVAQRLMAEDPKAATAEVRLQQYDEIYHDSNGTCQLDAISERRFTNEVYLG